jgi:hypothetical protein
LWSIYQEGRIVIHLSREEDCDPFIKKGRIVIQLSRGGGLWSIYQEGRNVIHLSRGEDCDPFIKRGGLWSSYQEGRIVIQFLRGEDCDPFNRFNPATCCACPNLDLDFKLHVMFFKFMFCEPSWVVVVRFVDESGIVDHHCLNLPSVIIMYGSECIRRQLTIKGSYRCSFFAYM